MAEMSVFFNNSQRPILPRVIEALQQLQDNPQQLVRDRDRRYDEPPPPYPESGQTTQPPTPGSPEDDEYFLDYQRRVARGKSKPLVQFKAQAKRELERVEHQGLERRFGRRQTLPWDLSMDIRANTENNVRSRWVEQGIWGDEWGPAWPPESQPMSWLWVGSVGPFWGPHNPTTSKAVPGARWGHEEYPEPEPESESEPEPEPEQRPLFGIWGLSVGKRKQPKPPRPIGYIQTPLGPIPQFRPPRPTVRNPEASRPYHQFLYQISTERAWIKDEMDHKMPGSFVDLDGMAYQSVKDNWIKDGIWNPTWGQLPGRTWFHEECDVGGAAEAPGASGDSERRPRAAHDDRQQAHGPQDAHIFGPPPIPEVADGGSDGRRARAPGHAEASDAETQPSGTAEQASSPQPAMVHGAQDPEQVPRRSLRSAQAETRARPGDSAATFRSQVQHDPSVGPAQIPSQTGHRLRGGLTSSQGHHLGESQSLNTGEGSSPKRRSDAVEECKQPPKRPRYNTRKSDGSSHKMKAVSCEETVGSASGTSRGKRSGPVIPLRRSSRIAEREGKRGVDVQAEAQARQLRQQAPARVAKPAKTAKSATAAKSTTAAKAAKAAKSSKAAKPSKAARAARAAKAARTRGPRRGCQ